MASKSNVAVKLIGGDGNVFNIIGQVTKALRRKGLGTMAEEYKAKVMKSRSYEEALQITMEYVEVE